MDVEHRAYPREPRVRRRLRRRPRSWPRPMTLEQNLSDLEQHAQDFHDRVGFTYTVLDPVDRDVIGCVYLYPSPLDGVDMRARSWVRRTHATWTNRSGERSAHGSTGRIGRSSGSTSPRADPPTAPSVRRRHRRPERRSDRHSSTGGYSSRRVSSTVSSSASRFAVASAVTPMTSCKYSATPILPTGSETTQAVAFALRRLPGPRPDGPRPFPRHRAIGCRHHPPSGDTANRVDPPCQQPPAVLIIWPAAPSIIDANPRAIANVAAPRQSGSGRS